MTNTNNEQLATVSASIDSFLALPVYNLLSDVPSDLSLKVFIPSKDNSSVLAGTQDLWRNINVSQFDFALPDPVEMPDVDSFPDTAAGMRSFKEAMNEYKDIGKPYNDSIKALQAKLINHDIKRKYDRLVRTCQFVQSHDPAMFDHREELDLHQLSETQRKAILAVYQQHFALSPRLNLTGSYVDLVAIDPTCSLDSIAGIDAIIRIKNNNPSASYAFMSKEITLQALQAIYGKVNQATYVKCFSRLDTHSGGSKNSTTIVANLRMLLGFVPTKGKAKSV